LIKTRRTGTRLSMTLELEHLLDATVTLDEVVDVGQTLQGHRRIINITGGHFEGTRMQGTIHASGADWQVIRDDGSAYLDTRYTLETDDGALIYVQNTGFRHGPPEVLEKLARGQDVDPSQYYFRTIPILETSAKKYAWVNKTVFVGTGARRPSSVELSFFEVK